MLRIRIKLLQRTDVQVIFAKFKHKATHWSVVTKKKTATYKAMEHFDDFYKKVFENAWPSMRHGLLGQKKQVAVVNYYGDIDNTMAKLEISGAINMRALFDLEKRYIKERKESNERSRKLEEIYKLDKEIDERVGKGVGDKIVAYTEKLDMELEASMKPELYEKIRSYEEGSERKSADVGVDDGEKIRNYKRSVADSLKNAEIDYSRIITPGSSDLSSALYEFVPATKIKGREEWITETQHYKYYDSSNEFSIKTEKEYNLNFPEHLNVYAYEKSNHTQFPSPKRASTGVFNYYLLDGASLLPVLALDLHPEDRLLDVCCAPGGKAYVALQTLYPETVVCNDAEASRVNRIEKVLREYFYDLSERFLSTGKIQLSHQDGLEMSLKGFNKILVDVPCTNDRLSLHEDDNNWFKSGRTKERLQLPELQSALLTNALKMVSVGGTVVYSTCSLSPIQNDGVVNMALRNIWEETSLEFVVKDLTPALRSAQCCFHFAEPRILKFGHLVIPYLPQNYGPMYFCKIVRTK